MLLSSLSRMFHVKHPSPDTDMANSGAAPADRDRVRMFHVKHRDGRPRGRRGRRRGGLVAVAALALLATGCASIQSPEGWAAPTEASGDLLVQSSTGKMSLVDPESGSVVWTFPEEGGKSRAFYATPLVEGGTVYLASYDGRIVRLELGSGTPSETWSAEVDAHIVATPALADGMLYVPTADGRVVLISADDGLVTNTLRTSDRRIWGAPAFRGGTIYLGDLDNGTTVAIDAATGDVQWEQEISGPSAADLTLDGDLLFVGAFDQHLHALDTANGGAERWAFPGEGWFLARPLIEGGVVYAVTMNGFVYAIDRETGQEIWTFSNADAEFRAAPALIGGNVIAVARDGQVFALNAASGEQIWQTDVNNNGSVNADPFVSGDEIYLVTSKHELVRVDASRQGAFQNVPLATADDD